MKQRELRCHDWNQSQHKWDRHMRQGWIWRPKHVPLYSLGLVKYWKEYKYWLYSSQKSKCGQENAQSSLLFCLIFHFSTLDILYYCGNTTQLMNILMKRITDKKNNRKAMHFLDHNWTFVTDVSTFIFIPLFYKYEWIWWYMFRPLNPAFCMRCHEWMN